MSAVVIRLRRPSPADVVVSSARAGISDAAPMAAIVAEAEMLARATALAIADTRDGAVLASVYEAIPGPRLAAAFLEAFGEFARLD